MMREWSDRRTGSGRCKAVALALPLVLAGVSGVGAVTLEEAVRAALKTNPDIGAVVENRRAVDFELSQARSGFLPTLDLNASSGKEYANNSTTRGRQLDGDDSRTTSLPTTTFGFTIRQLLFDGFDTLSQVERQEARVRSAARRVRETSEFIGQDAAEAYLESLRQRELIRISEQNVRAHEVFLELVRARVAGGAAGRAEEEQARQRLAGARDAVTQADGLRRDADARYRRIVGEEPVNMVRPVVPVAALPTTVNQAIELAIQFNPTVRVSRSDIEVAEAEFKQTNSSYWPQLSFEVTGNTNRNSGGSRGQDTTVSALFVMNYNLYRGGADIARRSEFLARLAEARQRLAQSQRATDENTRVAWNALENIRDRIKQLEAIVKANEAIRDSFKKEFDVGRRDLLDLLNAENDYFQAKGTLVSNQFVEMLGVYRLLGTTGLLMAALDVEQAKESFLSEAESAAFNSGLQRYVEATPVLNFQNDGTGTGGTGQPGAPLTPPLVPGGPVINPLAPIQGGGAPGVDLMSPLGPVLDPNAPAVPGGAVLDPNAPVSGGAVLDPTLPLPNATGPSVPGGAVLDPTLPVSGPTPPVLDPSAPVLNPAAPVPGVPQGRRPAPPDTTKPTSLLRQARLVPATPEAVAEPYTDKPRLMPLPSQLGSRGVAPVPQQERVARPGPGAKDAQNVWWFGPAATTNGKGESAAERAAGAPTAVDGKKTTDKKQVKPRPPAWGFD